MSQSNAPDTIADRITRVRERIASAARRAGRPDTADPVRLVAVTKRVNAVQVAEALAAGVSDLGENYVQEARAKIPEVVAAGSRNASWHLIGHLQSNKAKYSVELFSLIHSVDNYQLAQELGKQAVKRAQTQAILLEVNLTGGQQRAGVSPAEALHLAEQVAGIPGVALQGFMGMAPPVENPEEARPYFAGLRTLWERLPEENRQILSMGMSGDFEAAIEEGATMVRIGTALFGPRGGV